MEFAEMHRRRLVTFVYNDRVLISGSSLEIPAAYFMIKPTDIDYMLYRVQVCAIPKNSQPPKHFRGEILTIEPEVHATGYVKLRSSNMEFEKHLRTFDYDNPHGPAITQHIGWSAVTFDNVFSVQCPYWPPEAEEWKTRHRPHGWPSKELIDQIVSEGCFLVGKSHPSYMDDDKTQWRYSFSKAEVRLVTSWTDSQKYVYHVLRLMKTQFVKESEDKKKTGLCTYHLKTQMFWACEEQPAEFWDEQNLLNCICELLKQIEQHFAARNLPSYFLPDCSIIEGISIEDNLREGIKMIDTELGRLILMSMLPPKVCRECWCSISFPRELSLYWHLFAKRFDISFQVHRTKLTKLEALIHEDLNDLMNGIYNLKLAKVSGDSYYVAAEEHLSNSIATPGTIIIGDIVKQTHVTLSTTISENIVTATFESFENAELSVAEQESQKWDFSIAIHCTKSQCPYSGKSWTFPWDEALGNFSEKWLSPSHFLSAAYLTNVYFRTGNFKRCIEFVTEKHYFANNVFNTELFPMIFSPEMASLFDDDIQAVLGLLWLCQRLWVSDLKKDFELCTCPHLFMLYVRIQAALRLGDFEVYSSCVSSFLGHRNNCKFRLHLYSYHFVLLEMAWRIWIRLQE